MYIGVVGVGNNMGSVIDALPNYTGPYISDGIFQTSVEFGSATPKDQLDALSRLHDSAYAKYKDFGHRKAADVIYANEARKLIGLYPELAGLAVKYGNQIIGSASNLLGGYKYGPLGFVAGAIKNGLDLHDYMLNSTKYKNDVSQYYNTDPKLSDKSFRPDRPGRSPVPKEERKNGAPKIHTPAYSEPKLDASNLNSNVSQIFNAHVYAYNMRRRRRKNKKR